MLAIFKKTFKTPKYALANVIFFVLVSLLYFIGRSHVIQNETRNRNVETQEINSYYQRLQYFIWPGMKLKDKLRHRALTWETTVNNIRQRKRAKRFPDVFIVGAERCGSEALGNLLRLHPLIKPASSADLKFFTANYGKGPLYYKEKMPWASEDEIVLETSPAYFSWPPMSLPKRIKSIIPDAKILVLLCDPAHRTNIDFKEELKTHRINKETKYEIFLGTYLRKFGSDKLSTYQQWDGKIQSIIFDAFTEDYISHVITSGIYYYHAIRWKSEFDSEHLMFLNRDDLLQKTGEQLERIQKFLRIPTFIFKEDFTLDNKTETFCFDPVWMSRSQPPDRRCPLVTESRIHADQSRSCEQSLKQFYEVYNKKLYQLIGYDFGWLNR